MSKGPLHISEATLSLPIPKDAERVRHIRIDIFCSEDDEPIVNNILDSFLEKEWIKAKSRWIKISEKNRLKGSKNIKY